MKNKIYLGIAFVLLSALCSSIGQLVWKLMVVHEAKFLYYIIGLGLYGLGALLLIIAFEFGDMSVLHPMLSFGFIFAMIWSVKILNETITIQKVAGTACIIIGVVLLAIGNKKSTKGMDKNGITN